MYFLGSPSASLELRVQVKLMVGEVTKPPYLVSKKLSSKPFSGNESWSSDSYIAVTSGLDKLFCELVVSLLKELNRSN